MALTKVEADGINLADTFAFTGTISGSGYDLLASVSSTSTQSSVEISLPTGYTSYYLTIYSETDSSSNGHYHLTYKRDGQSSFDTSSYTTQGKLLDITNNQLNTNSGGSALQLVASDSGLDGGGFRGGLGGPVGEEGAGNKAAVQNEVVRL